ncbi:MAG: hypothetical protein ACRERX_23025 [Pseudomonas sp.]
MCESQKIHHLLRQMAAHLDVVIAANDYSEAASARLGRPVKSHKEWYANARRDLSGFLEGRLVLAMTVEELRESARYYEQLSRERTKEARFYRVVLRVMKLLFGTDTPPTAVQTPSTPTIGEGGMVAMSLAFSGLWLASMCLART